MQGSRNWGGWCSCHHHHIPAPPPFSPHRAMASASSPPGYGAPTHPHPPPTTPSCFRTPFASPSSPCLFQDGAPSARPTTPASDKKITLHHWYLVWFGNFGDSHTPEVAVGGFLSQELLDNEKMETAPIVDRIKKDRLITKDGFDVTLVGYIDTDATYLNGFPFQVAHYFLTGFPFIWNHLVNDLINDSKKSNNTILSTKKLLPEHAKNQTKSVSKQPCQSSENKPKVDAECETSVLDADVVAVSKGENLIHKGNVATEIGLTAEGQLHQEKERTNRGRDLVTDEVPREQLDVQKEIDVGLNFDGIPEERNKKRRSTISERTNRGRDLATDEVPREQPDLQKEVDVGPNFDGIPEERNKKRRSTISERTNRGRDLAKDEVPRQQPDVQKEVDVGPNFDGIPEERNKKRRSTISERTNRGRDLATDDVPREQPDVQKEVDVGPNFDGIPEERNKKSRSTISILPPPVPIPRVHVSKELVSECLGLKVSRYGRLLVPPLAFWKSQTLVHAMDGEIIGIINGSAESAKADAGQINIRPSKKSKTVNLQTQRCAAATDTMARKKLHNQKKAS